MLQDVNIFQAVTICRKEGRGSSHGWQIKELNSPDASLVGILLVFFLQQPTTSQTLPRFPYPVNVLEESEPRITNSWKSLPSRYHF